MDQSVRKGLVLWESITPLNEISFNWNRKNSFESYYPMIVRLDQKFWEPIIRVRFFHGEFICTKCFFVTKLQKSQLKDLQMRFKTIPWPADFTNTEKDCFALVKNN